MIGAGIGVGALAAAAIALLVAGVFEDERETSTAAPPPSIAETTVTSSPTTVTTPPTTAPATTTAEPDPVEEVSVLSEAGLASYDFVDAAVGLIAIPIEEANAGWEERSMPFPEAEELFGEASLLARDLARFVTTDQTLRSDPSLFTEVSRLQENVAALPSAFRKPDRGEERRSTISAIRSSYVAIASLSDQRRSDGAESCSSPLVTAALYVTLLVDDATDDEFNRWSEGISPMRDLNDLEDSLSAVESLLWLISDDALNIETAAVVESAYALTVANQDLAAGIQADDFDLVSQGVNAWNAANADLPPELPDEYCASGDLGL